MSDSEHLDLPEGGPVRPDSPFEEMRLGPQFPRAGPADPPRGGEPLLPTGTGKNSAAAAESDYEDEKSLTAEPKDLFPDLAYKPKARRTRKSETAAAIGTSEGAMSPGSRITSHSQIKRYHNVCSSDLAGRFPDSDNVNKLRENLFNKIDLVRADHERWKLAIIDAGINPKQLRGKNTAVIIGTAFNESQKKFLYETAQLGGQNIIGCSKSTTANMISYYFDLKGPSYTVDTACSSGPTAVAVAYNCIKSGICEDAIIGTANLCFVPAVTQLYARLGVVSLSGYCKPFDIAGNGYSRSETVSVIYLQKVKNAKRIYAIFPNIKINNDGYKEEGITYPSSIIQSTLLTEVYNECGISTSCLDYMEAHGTGTKVGDLQEINAISNVLCKNRETPLMIGSVKSNLGHAEPASGFTQIAKVIIAFETGFVPPNINYTSPRNDIDALVNGTVRVVEKPLPLKNGYIGISSFGFGGSNAHTLLKWNPKQKVNNGAPNDDLPRLVILSGRTKESVKLFINDIANHQIDVEYIRLLHDVHSDNIDGHPWRGYIILNTSQQESIQEIQNLKNGKRPVCFIFSALGSQWPGIGRYLLKFQVFANAIKMCDDVLKPYNISVTDILTNSEENVCKNALYTFLGIIAEIGRAHQKNHAEIPNRMGTISNVKKFDADFFGLSFEQADTLSSEARMLLEHSYESIIDAGINPKQLRGKNTAVIVAITYVELQNPFLYITAQLGGQNIIGCSKSTTANMISHYFDLKGPSYTIDSACSSSLSALAIGYNYIMSGICEDAIIGTANICLFPVLTLHFFRRGVLSPTGYCKPFDTAANGYVRSETVSAMYLQKAKNAKRIYAICPHVKLNSDGYKEEGITYPSSFMQSTLLTEFYNECGIPTSCLDYVEAHGTATKAGDPPEINAISSVLCKNRETPLMIGSVKSNLGHAEPASGFSQIAKCDEKTLFFSPKYDSTFLENFFVLNTMPLAEFV
ncbi:PREDICTED: fatty acid synthase-like [Wasmannia auropunctata]|uniref:fatty acid synthase-like n=1 Tax=Wasmannia auropunctata TaxID=64793 RepID=UPI0005EEBA29|nr:PREDICTED: fatty acid synthase-like [Wasmannia auropunctata]